MRLLLGWADRGAARHQPEEEGEGEEGALEGEGDKVDVDNEEEDGLMIVVQGEKSSGCGACYAGGQEPLEEGGVYKCVQQSRTIEIDY